MSSLYSVRLTIPLLICGGLLVVPLICAGQSPIGRESRFADEDDSIPKDWALLSTPASIEALQAIADTTRANYETIRTWKATCAVRSLEHISQNYVASSFGANVDEPSELRQEFDYAIEFAVDVPSNSFSWHKKTQRMSFYRSDSNEPLEIPNVKPTDGNYVAKSEEFVSFSPDTEWPGFSVLSNFPEAQNKRAAFLRSREFYGGRTADLLDPREFFGFSSELKFWEALDSYAASLKGDFGEERVAEMEKRLTVHEADSPQGKWYRVAMELNAPHGGGKLYSSSIWSPSTGYHPISYVMSRDVNGEQPLSMSKWEWEQANGIYVPTRCKSESYSENRARTQWARDVVLTNNSVNVPLDADQFTYVGMGMANGDIILDYLEETVLILRDGVVEKLADFGDKYVPPGESSFSLRGIMIAVTILFIAVLLVLVWRRRSASA